MLSRAREMPRRGARRLLAGLLGSRAIRPRVARLPLILPIVTVMVATSGTVLVLAEHSFRSQVRHELRARGESALEQFTRGVADVRRVHATYARLLEDTPGLALAVERSEPMRLRRLLEPIEREQAFQEITIYDRRGAEVVNVGAPIGDRIDASLYAAARTGRTATEAVIDPDGLGVLAATPIRRAGETVGVLVTGSTLSGADLAQLEHQRGAQLAVFHHGVVATTTVRRPALLRTLRDTPLSGKRATELRRALEPFDLHPAVSRLGKDGALVAMSSGADLRQFSRDRLLLLLLGAGLLIGTVTLISVYLTRTVLRPVEAMAAATGRMTAGDYSRRVAPSRIPELDTLAKGVNHLAERIEQQLRDLSHQAFHDRLTDLPNRALFVDRLKHALARARSGARSVVVVFLDLDDFKVVNDSLGHDVADRLLVEVGARLRRHLRPEDTIARLGGDEFTVLLEDVAGVGDAIATVNRIRAVFDDPFEVAGKKMFVTASLGLTIASGGEDPGTLLRQADMAMYRAKLAGKARFEIFDETMSAQVEDRMALQTDLRNAVPRNELVLHYQPIVDLATEEIVQVEALVRWNHPERGLVPPLQFISLAEESGLIVSVGRWVLAEACRQVKYWHERYGVAIGLSVNLSPRQLQHPDLVDEVADVLVSSGLEPRCVRLEITESVMAENVEPVLSTMHALVALGVDLDIDDFGTGYSSLVYLKRFPVKGLKIDREFVAGLERSQEDLAIVEATATVAKALALDLTAEGVENAAQAALLRSVGCERAQGYHFSRPLPGEEIEPMLAGPRVPWWSGATVARSRAS